MFVDSSDKSFVLRPDARRAVTVNKPQSGSEWASESRELPDALCDTRGWVGVGSDEFHQLCLAEPVHAQVHIGACRSSMRPSRVLSKVCLVISTWAEQAQTNGFRPRRRRPFLFLPLTACFASRSRPLRRATLRSLVRSEPVRSLRLFHRFL